MTTGAMKETICWPDIVPSEKTLKKTGEIRGKLTFTHPVFAKLQKYGREWHWLMSCKCGGEIILRQSASRTTCDFCGHAKIIKFIKPSKKMLEFNRTKTCIRGDFSCVHYLPCQEEVIETGRVSARYKPGCYEASEQEKKIMEY